MSVMTVLYVTGGPVGLAKTRAIDYTAGTIPFPVVDETTGMRAYRGQPYVAGTIIVEDAFTAAGLCIAVPQNVAFAVKTAGGVGTITFIGFKATRYRGAVHDGTRQNSPVVGYAVEFEGMLDNSVSAATAALHQQA